MSVHPSSEINKPVNKRILKPLYGHYSADKVGILQIDLMDMTTYKTRNKNFGYALLIIDVYSRYGWAIPIKRKYASDIYEAFKRWYESFARNESEKIDVMKVYSDIGSEFKGEFSTYLKDKGISQVMIDSKEQHQGIVERWIRTLKEKIRDSWVDNDNFNWVDVLPGIVEDYNNKIHSRMKAKPIDVLQGKDTPKFNYPTNEDKELNVGDMVRVITQKSTFDKPSLSHNYSKNVYEIVSFNGTSYGLNNGKSYPRWKLLKSKFQRSDAPKIEPINVQREIKAQKRVDEEMKREDIKKDNIIPERVVRERKPNVRLNDYYVGGGMSIPLNQYVRF